MCESGKLAERIERIKSRSTAIGRIDNRFAQRIGWILRIYKSIFAQILWILIRIFVIFVRFTQRINDWFAWYAVGVDSICSIWFDRFAPFASIRSANFPDSHIVKFALLSKKSRVTKETHLKQIYWQVINSMTCKPFGGYFLDCSNLLNIKHVNMCIILEI